MSYRNQFIFNVGKVESWDDVRKHLQQMADQCQKEYQAIQRLGISASPVSVIAVASGGGGGGGSAVVSNLVANQAVVGTDWTPITFSQSVVNPIVLYRCVNSNNESVGCDIDQITFSGFRAKATESSTLYFCALPRS